MDQKSYHALKKLALRQRLKYLAVLLGIWITTFVLYFIHHSKTGTKFTDPSGIAWVLLLMVPFLFKIHRRIFEKSWTGEVRSIRNPDSSERQAYLAKSYALPFLIKNMGYDLQVVKVHTDTAGMQEIILVGDEYGLGDSYYHIGERVVKFAGLKFPVSYTSERSEIFCPICGNFNTTDSKKCYVCKKPLVNPERVKIDRKKDDKS